MSTAQQNKDYMAAVAQKIQSSRMTILNPAEQYLNGVASLPPAPMLVTELLKLFREPDRDVDQVVQLISYEPSLTAQILRTCNSVCFAGDVPPGDVFEAVTRIGFYQVYCLVVSIFGAKTRSMEGAALGVNVEELWRHSVTVAVASSIVAEEAGEGKAVAFTAGLLHDIGKLVLASAERENYAKLIQRAKEQRVSVTGLERSVLGVDHAELGGELMRRWKLPPDVVAAVSRHHDLEAPPPYSELTASVQIGDMIAHKIAGDDETNKDLLTSSSVALFSLQMHPDELPRLIEMTQEELEKVKGMLEM